MNTKNSRIKNTITENFIEEIRERLIEGKQIRRSLPLDGRLHIDRALPFIVVYRRPIKRIDRGTDNLVKGEASYLVASGSRKLKPGLTELTRTIVETLSNKFKAFLIIEIWSGEDSPIDFEIDDTISKPAFRIFISQTNPPTKSVEVLESSLRKMRIQKRTANVEVVYNNKLSPPGLESLISIKNVKEFNCFTIGIEIQPIYRDPTNNDIFPLVLRQLQLSLTRALKQTFFAFSNTQTALRPSHYLALGRRAVVKAVWRVDSMLADISNKFDFLLLLTPVNVEYAWTKFKNKQFDHDPVFFYRPRPVDTAILKRKLYEIPIERVEDPTLAYLFHEKRTELDRQLTMLDDRETPQFLYSSLQLFGNISDNLFNLSKNILQVLPARSRELSKSGYLNAEEFADIAFNEIEYYKQFYPSLSSRIQIRDDVVGLMVSRGNLLISRNIKIPISRSEALIQHEVGTHVVTYFNGLSQPFKQLYSGLAGYEELQEGLAVLSEYFVDGLSRPRLRLLAGRVIAARCIIDGASFIDTFREMNLTYGFDQWTAFTLTARIYRSGGFTKDIVYLRGLVNLLNYLKKDGILEPLFVGKIAIDHIPIIQELQLRKVLHPAPLYPRYFKNAQIKNKLNLLRNGLTVLNLIERRKI
ncbi:MAG: DUF1704 domain-containing protein [Ignavibacteria bacterium]|nr:DUF1704 domain-containing protein [Ignavibacteria bacterium]